MNNTNKKKLTPNQKAYSKEVQRLQRAIARLEKNKNLTLDLADIVDLNPKRITKTKIQNIKNIKNKDLSAYARPVISVVDEVRDMLERLPEYRQLYNRAGHNTVYVDLSSLKQQLISLLDDNSLEDGYDAYLEQNKNKIEECIDGVVYDSNQSRIDGNMSELLTIIKASSLTRDENYELDKWEDI